MKQLLQRFDTGELQVMDVPVPAARGVNLLVQARASLISPGTERMVVELARASLIDKARSRPDQVAQVLQKVRTDGVAATVDAVRTRLETPITLGYCNAGVVIEAGGSVRNFAPGDRVVTNGSHSEFVLVPHTLAARIPPNVDDASASFTPLAAIALQGIRLADPTLGETVVVYGLGVIGLLAVQLLRVNGCRVIAIDRDADRLELGKRFGAVAIDGRAEDSVARVLALTNGIGADAVLLTLSSTSNEPVHEAAAMSRRRGRLVLVGVTGLQLRRDDFYRKELTFAVSCSYGPGRYDPAYEDEGQDYPIGFVRWTEQRNFEAVLALLANGSMDVRPLITHRLPFERVLDAYDIITSPNPGLGVVLEYGPSAVDRTVRLTPQSFLPPREGGRTGVAGVIGAGTFAQRTLLPAMRAAGFGLRTIVSSGGTSATVAGGKFGFQNASTELQAVFSDEHIDTVFVLTRHDSHAELALRALESGRHVFVEKPLALTMSDLDQLEAAATGAGGLLTVGFNRRFAPLALELREAVRERAGPLALIVTVNAGALPADHWTQHPELGGGRIAGEACHFIDLCRALTGAPIEEARCTIARRPDGHGVEDIAHLSLCFRDGSTAVIHYLASGARTFPKERVEAFIDGRTLVIENWLRLRRYGAAARRRSPKLRLRLAKQDKGHRACVQAWRDAIVSGGPPPIPLDELFEVSRWTLRLAEQARG